MPVIVTVSVHRFVYACVKIYVYIMYRCMNVSACLCIRMCASYMTQVHVALGSLD